MADSVNSTSTTPYIPESKQYKNQKEYTTDTFDNQSFLKLMIEQLKNQDPLSPMDNSQFVEQTALMTMVERLTNIETIVKDSNSNLLNVKEYESLIGKTATYEVTYSDGSKEEKTGTISSVKMDDGDIFFTIGEDTVAKENIKGLESTGMSNGSLVNNAIQSMQMIGQRISYQTATTVDADNDSSTTDDVTTSYETKEAVISGIELKNGQLSYQLDNGETVTADAINGLTIQSDTQVNNAMQYAQLVGYLATYMNEITNSDGSTTKQEETAAINAISMKNDMVELVLDNGARISPSAVIGLESAN
ncbi:flagellar hook capping FlgD N-terminal domain-containing protein [Brevibacillus fulvus]|uniref:Basal-body rod modification protein FlgD n=1 Tax=Brevibacillus fulvus TaxID=1125967 RepID=A0A939BQB8_9BACL|nr:flagellar hook capping FlgD N-terminal domain-containing protein [Brevibacillus fulvus]MBM7591450.1 flagellar basal-body rod modification protein FlgD [Brevibacillus fulvus]